MAINTIPNKHTTQNILNWSFDPDYNVLVVGLLGFSGSGATRLRTSANGELIEDYEFAGIQSAGGYTYFGFKKRGLGDWKIMRMTDADDSEVLFAYGTTGFASSWATPAGESYALPPDS